MPLNRRAINKYKAFDQPLSFKTDEAETKLKDIRNLFFNKGKLDTRNGMSRFNATALGGPVLSTSFFKDSSGTTNIIAKVGTTLVKVNATGGHTVIKSGLTATNVHTGVTLNNRHIITVEGNGIFAWDGTTFSNLGSDVPAIPSVATSGAGNSLDADDYRVACTFYSSQYGFESNIGVQTADVTVASGKQIDVTSIDTTTSNGFIDKVRVYVNNVTDNTGFLFFVEIDLGTTTATIDTNATSSRVPPSDCAAPISGGGKYMTTFNRKLVYAGNATFKNDVFFSGIDKPDCFSDEDDRVVIQCPGDGAVSGLSTGLFNDSQLDPYVVIFKRTSTHIYSEIGGQAKFATINDKVGCVSHESIIVRNGHVFFLSQSGWRAIVNGRLLTNKQGEAVTLGDGDVDDIFTVEDASDFSYALDKSQLAGSFGVYYATLDQYITWVIEADAVSASKQYVWEFDKIGFTTYRFAVDATSAMIGESSTGEEVVYFSGANGYIYQHSISEAKTDIDKDNNAVTIDAFMLMPWFGGTEDYDSTYSFRELILRATTSLDDITVRAFVNFSFLSADLHTYSFPTTNTGFVLDVSKLDEGVFGDSRERGSARADINRTGENILIGFYQNIAGANMGLINGQLHFNKNGNRNLN